jgi:hypothetical protein
MPSLPQISLALGLALSVLASSGPSNAAGTCRALSHAAERSKLQQLLSRNLVSDSEQAFLLAGAEQRLKELQPRSLNARGVQCGIDAVRTQVLGCMNSVLPSILRTASSDKKSSKLFWGRAKLSDSGLGFIGSFHACRGAAMETFMFN